MFYSNFNLENFLQNHWANFNQTWHNAFLGKGNPSCSNRRPCLFPGGDNNEIDEL